MGNISDILNPVEGQNALAQAMVSPISNALYTQSLGRKLLMVTQLPGEIIYYNKGILGSMVNSDIM